MLHYFKINWYRDPSVCFETLISHFSHLYQLDRPKICHPKRSVGIKQYEIQLIDKDTKDFLHYGLQFLITAVHIHLKLWQLKS